MAVFPYYILTKHEWHSKEFFLVRRYEQQQILTLLTTLEEAQRRINIVATEEARINLLSEMLEFCRNIGVYIESVCGEGTSTVASLEEYCDTLYLVSKGENTVKKLGRRLTGVQNNARFELKPDTVEIVFISYKASMSDSLESIYLAAKEDPGCNAIWLPVPYFDRNPDGTFNNMNYEGADYYSDKFSCTLWTEYNMEARHPDVIFTFNPYDGNNLVTSIHPEFYCESLRECTDLLVYIPYIVHSGIIDPPTYPGCVCANKIIVQSEDVREQYIHALMKYTGQKSSGALNDRVLALGSPKIDKVLNDTGENYDLPPAWKNIISDGNNARTVIFYNTSLGALLQNTIDKDNRVSDLYLRKLRSVFDFFKKRDDVVLLWRPHPLSAVTLSSMRKALLPLYLRLVETYTSGKYGIYDDSPDLHRAIALSDALYGDESSVNCLFHAVGKPVFIQNFNLLNYDTALLALPKAEEMLRAFFDSEFILYESEKQLQLKDFISYLDKIISYGNEQSHIYLSKFANADGTSGEAIYRYVKSLSNSKRGYK
jgi:hypothetical protein